LNKLDMLSFALDIKLRIDDIKALSADQVVCLGVYLPVVRIIMLYCLF